MSKQEWTRRNKIADVDRHDRDETTNLIISIFGKLAQKEYKTWYDWVGKVIHRELCKKLEFDLMKRWYMHNPESFLENEIRDMNRSP